MPKPRRARARSHRTRPARLLPLGPRSPFSTRVRRSSLASPRRGFLSQSRHPAQHASVRRSPLRGEASYPKAFLRRNTPRFVARLSEARLPIPKPFSGATRLGSSLASPRRGFLSQSLSPAQHASVRRSPLRGEASYPKAFLRHNTPRFVARLSEARLPTPKPFSGTTRLGSSLASPRRGFLPQSLSPAQHASVRRSPLRGEASYPKAFLRHNTPRRGVRQLSAQAVSWPGGGTCEM